MRDNLCFSFNDAQQVPVGKTRPRFTQRFVSIDVGPLLNHCGLSQQPHVQIQNMHRPSRCCILCVACVNSLYPTLTCIHYQIDMVHILHCSLSISSCNLLPNDLL